MKDGEMKLGEKAGPFGDAYYGWIIVAVALISMVFWFGIRTSFSVFYVALLEDFAWSRAGSAGIQSMALITYTVLSPIVGGLIDRFGPRSVICPGFWCLLYRDRRCLGLMDRGIPFRRDPKLSMGLCPRYCGVPVIRPLYLDCRSSEDS